MVGLLWYGRPFIYWTNSHKGHSSPFTTFNTAHFPDYPYILLLK